MKRRRGPPLAAPGKSARPIHEVHHFIVTETGEILSGLLFGQPPDTICRRCQTHFHKQDAVVAGSAPHVPEPMRAKAYCSIRCLSQELFERLSPDEQK